MPAKLHVFVVMPFGKKPDAQGNLIDFNSVFDELLRPALETVGLEVFRADLQLEAGEIREEMFQELLIADLVVADLTIDNPNVWYELGVRHALRSRGVLLVQGPRDTQPFDIYTDRKYRYRLQHGRPDPGSLAEDREAIAKRAHATLEVWHGKRISPVYALLPNLVEPDWKSLRVGAVTKFWAQHDAWSRRLDLARRSGHLGDMLVLADEAPIAALRVEAHLRAGIALRNAEAYRYALEQIDHALAIDPENDNAAREKGLCLQRLAQQGVGEYSLEAAREHYDNHLATHPNDAEAWALRGRIDKDAWESTWRDASTLEARIASARIHVHLLRAAVESYLKGLRVDPHKFYAGVNALSLMCLHRHLLPQDHRFERAITQVEVIVRFAIDTGAAQDFWTLATLGDLAVLFEGPDELTEKLGHAIATAHPSRFDLNAVRMQLELLRTLDFNPRNAEAGIALIDAAIQALPVDKQKLRPRKVFLFSGHRIDEPGRKTPRFPPHQEPVAAAEIARALDTLEAGPDDLALCQASAGGDLLFLEACQRRGLSLRILLPFAEPKFIAESIAPCDPKGVWTARYHRLKDSQSAKAGGAWKLRLMPEALGPDPKGLSPYERCNLWLLYTALSFGIHRVHFICLWDGEKGDGPGGAAHMYDEVNDRTGQVQWIRTRDLW